ncbi:MAG: hypothetical protein RLZZ292_2241 [Bacteroidota bacterium]|jgi:hypothetical protein
MFQQVRSFFNRVLFATSQVITPLSPTSLGMNNLPAWGEPNPYAAKSVMSRVQKPYLFRTELAMDSFRSALESAENPLHPDRRLLYTIYRQVLLDDQVITQRRIALSAIKRAPFSVVPENGGASNLKKQRLFKKTWFINYLEAALDTEFWGHSLIEFNADKDEKGEFRNIEVIPRDNVRPEFGDILYLNTDTSGLLFRNNPELKYCLEIMKHPFDLGLLLCLCKPVTKKSYADTDWSRRSEKFGMPFIDIGTRKTQKKEIDELQAFAANFGANGYFVRDLDDEEVKIVESRQTDGHAIYLERIKLSNEEVAKIINGQTGSSDEKAFVGAAQVHERILNDFTFARLQEIENYINDNLFPFLIGHGYALKGCRFQFDELLTQSSKQTTNNNEAGDPNSDDPKGNAPTPSANEKKKSALNLSYQTTDLCCAPSKTLAIADLSSYIEQAMQEVYAERTKAGDLNADLWRENFKQLFDAAQKGYGKNEHNTKQADPDFEHLHHLRQNAMVFAAFKNHENIEQMVALLRDKNGKKQTWDNFKRQATALNATYNVTHLQAEYNTANAAADMAAKWHNIARDFGPDAMLRYSTVGDKRVRKAHISLDRTTYPMSHDFWKTYYPPNGWNCRCSVIVVSKDQAPVAPLAYPDDKETPDMFRFNPGLTDQLFSDEHSYFQVHDKAVANKIKKASNKLAFDEYDATKWEKTHFDNESGGFVATSKEHGKTEKTANASVAKRLAGLSERVELLPILAEKGVKSLDATRNEDLWDFKVSQTQNGKNAIQNSIKSASNQKAKRVLITIQDAHNESCLIQGIEASFQKGRAQSIEVVELLFENNTLLRFDVKKHIRTGKYKEMLQKHKR